MRRRTGRRRGVDPIIVLIDVTFHILIFFMIGGQLASTQARDLDLVETAGLDPTRPPDTLVLTDSGALIYRNAPTDVATHLASLDEAGLARVQIVADRDVPAIRLIEVANELRAEGAGSVILVTEQAMQSTLSQLGAGSAP